MIAAAVTIRPLRMKCSDVIVERKANKTKQTVVRQTPTPGRFFSHVASALQLYQSEGICFRAGLIVIQVEHT